MGFFSKIFKAVKKIAPVALGFLAGGPIGAGIGGALGSAVRGGNLKQIITGGLTGYGAGSAVGSIGSAIGNLRAGGTIGSAILGTPGHGLAAGVSGPVAPATQGLLGAGGSLGGGTLLNGSSSLLSAAQGLGSIAGVLGGGQVSPPIAGNQNKPAEPPKVVPFTRPSPMSAPKSLSAMSGFDPAQTRSYLATSGVNSGLGTEEDSYYRNLVQRSLIGDDNKVTDNMNSLLPIESQYFSGKGFDTSNVENFLRQIRGY